MALVFRALALSLEVGGGFYDLNKFYGSEIGKAKERKFETPTRETDCWASSLLSDDCTSAEIDVQRTSLQGISWQ